MWRFYHILNFWDGFVRSFAERLLDVGTILYNRQFYGNPVAYLDRL